MNFSQYQALTFDCYGTLIDWETGILNYLVPWAKKHGIPLSDEELLESFGAAESRLEERHKRTLYPQILALVLQDIASHFGVTPTGEELRNFSASVVEWPAFSDSAKALRRLQKHFKLIVLSNIDRASFAHSQTKLGVQFDAVVTAEDVGAYKPDLRMFARMFQTLKDMDIEQDQILHVAQSLYHDHMPAQALKMQSVWINRRVGKPGYGATLPPVEDVKPDLEVPTLRALADLVDQALPEPLTS